MNLVVPSALCFTWKDFCFYDIKNTAAEGVPGVPDMAEMIPLKPDPSNADGGIG